MVVSFDYRFLSWVSLSFKKTFKFLIKILKTNINFKNLVWILKMLIEREIIQSKNLVVKVDFTNFILKNEKQKTKNKLVTKKGLSFHNVFIYVNYE